MNAAGKAKHLCNLRYTGHKKKPGMFPAFYVYLFGYSNSLSGMPLFTSMVWIVNSPPIALIVYGTL